MHPAVPPRVKRRDATGAPLRNRWAKSRVPPLHARRRRFAKSPCLTRSKSPRVAVGRQGSGRPRSLFDLLRRCAASSVLGRQGARQLAQRLLMPLVGDLCEVARELQAHTLARADGTAALIVEALEKIAHGDAEDPSDLEQSAGGDPIDAALVFVRLLVGDANEIGKLLLGQAEHHPEFADPSTDMAFTDLCSARYSLHFGRNDRFFAETVSV